MLFWIKNAQKVEVLILDLEFDVKVTPGVLYDFKIQHTYKKPITILATALGFVSIYLFFTREDTTRFILLLLDFCLRLCGAIIRFTYLLRCMFWQHF